MCVDESMTPAFGCLSPSRSPCISKPNEVRHFKACFWGQQIMGRIALVLLLLPLAGSLVMHLSTCPAHHQRVAQIPPAQARSCSRPQMLSSSTPPPLLTTDTEDFERRIEGFAPTSELCAIRKQIVNVRTEMDLAVDSEDYVSAAMYRDDLRELQGRDPVASAADARAQLERAIEKERYSDAAIFRDYLRVLRRFMPQYQLAGLWKGTYPNHGEELIRVRYDGDTLFATKVTGDEHVPAGEVTFRAELATPCEPDAKGIEMEGDMVGVRVEVVSLSADGAPQQRDVERYHGEGRIAAKGFQHAHYVPGQLFLMDTDVIGFLWLPLGTLVVFNRVPEEEERQGASALDSATLPNLGEIARISDYSS